MDKPTNHKEPPPRSKIVLPGQGKTRKPMSTGAKLRAKEAYEYWAMHPYMLMVDIALKFKISPESVRAHLKEHGLKRPDGRDYSQKSSRQQWLEKAYKKAVKEKLNARQAAAWVEKESGHNCNKGDLHYYAMKLDLPYLPEPVPAKPAIPAIVSSEYRPKGPGVS